MNREILFFTKRTTLTFRQILNGANHAARSSGLWTRTIVLDGCRQRPSDIVREADPLAVCFYDPAGALEKDISEIGGTLPTVLFCPPDTSRRTSRKSVMVITRDQTAIGRLAAHELLRLGRDHFAVLGWRENAKWSDARSRAFVDAIESVGGTVAKIDWRPADDPVRDEQSLMRALLGLVRPCALFAVNDETAALAVNAAAKAGIAVPGELAVLGVDNLVDVCESCATSISSIEPDYIGAGALAIRSILQARSGMRTQVRVFSDAGVVRRASSRPERPLPKPLDDILEFIRLHAAEGIGARDVLRAYARHRRAIEQSFRKFVGHAITDEIQSVRIDLAKRLLRNPTLSIAQIGALVGYVSKNQLERIFKAATGVSLRVWRTHGRQTPACGEQV